MAASRSSATSRESPWPCLTAMLAPYASSGRLLVPARARADPGRRPGRPRPRRDRPRSQDRPASDRWSPPISSTRPSWATCCRWPASSSSPAPRDRPQPASRTPPTSAQPDNQQAITCCFAVDYLDGQDHTIERPAEYDFWRDFVPALKPAWPGRLLDLTYADPITLKPASRGFDPRGAGAGLWVYRRILDPRNFQPGAYPGSSGTTLVNWPQNDYWLGPLVGTGDHARPTPSGTSRGPSSSACRSCTGSRPNAPGPTARPAGRACGCGPTWSEPTTAWPRRPTSANRGASRPSSPCSSSTSAPRPAGKRQKAQDVQAEPFPDSVGVGSYRIDLHPSTGGDNYIDISSLPFQIPLGALIPRRVENLLPACKNLGTTHITNGCYRLHPVEWAIGEAAGALAAYCLEQNESPRAVRNTPKSLTAFQARLRAQGVEIAWPPVMPRS